MKTENTKNWAAVSAVVFGILCAVNGGIGGFIGGLVIGYFVGILLYFAGVLFSVAVRLALWAVLLGGAVLLLSAS